MFFSVTQDVHDEEDSSGQLLMCQLKEKDIPLKVLVQTDHVSRQVCFFR